MTIDREETELGPLCAAGGLIQTGPFGSQLHMSDYTTDGVPVIMPTNIGDGRVIEDRIMRTSSAKADSLSRHKVRPGDIVYSRRGDITRRALITSAEAGWLCGTGCLLVRPSARVHPRWLSYWLGQPTIHRWLLNQSVGATMANLNTDILTRVPVSLPPFHEQRRIACALGAFDDLIEINRDLTRSQEALARALASRGDDEVAIEEIAEVPQLRQRRPTGLVDHFAIPAFDNGQLPAHDLGSTILSGKYVLRQPSVLVSRLNPSTPRTWMAYPGMEEAVCSPEFVVLTGRYGVSTEEVWAVTSGDDFWRQMQSSVGGTTNSRQRVDKAAVPELIVPDVRLLSAEERAAISTLVRGAYELRVEAAELAAHRDELLPLLMSGRVRVSEVEGVAEHGCGGG